MDEIRGYNFAHEMRSKTKFWASLLSACTLLSPHFMNPLLRSVTRSVSSCAALNKEVTKTIHFGLKRCNPGKMRQVSMNLASLERVALNRLLHFDSKIAVIPDDDSPTSAVFHCSSVNKRGPDKIDLCGENPLSQIPFLFASNRMGISLGMGCCQSLASIGRLCQSRKPHVTGNDIIIAVAALLTNLQKMHLTKWCERDLSTAGWKKFNPDFPYESAMTRIDTLIEFSGNSSDDAITFLRDENPDIYGLVFGRIKRALTSLGEISSVSSNSAVVVLTEQMNLIDILPFLACSEIDIYYSPLTLRTRLILEALINHYFKNRNRATNYVFSPALTPVFLEYQLRERLKRTSDNVCVCLGGSIASYLTGLKITRQFPNAQIYEPS